MANFYRITLFFLIFYSSFASATQPISIRWLSKEYPSIGPSSTPDAACSKVAGLFKTTVKSNISSGPDAYLCALSFNTGGQYQSYIAKDFYCPPGQTTTNNITCTGTAPPNCASKTGLIAQSATFDNSDGKGLSPVVCYGSCQAVISASSAGQLSCNFSSQIGICVPTVVGTYIYSGSDCTNASISSPTPVTQKSNCPQCDCFAKGFSYGVINGINTCVPQGTAGSLSVKTTANPINTINTPAPTSANPNPTPIQTTSPQTTTTISPSADGSSVPNVSVTIKNLDGSTTTKTQDKVSFCNENPNLNICKNSYFGGTCGAYSCDGDAIQCAIAKRIHLQRCDEEQAKIDLQAKPVFKNGEALMNGQLGSDVDAFISRTGTNTRNLNIQNNISETGPATFSGDGLKDISNTVMGQNFTLPMQRYNIYLNYMGYILVSLSYFAAFKIVMGSIK